LLPTTRVSPRDGGRFSLLTGCFCGSSGERATTAAFAKHSITSTGVFGQAFLATSLACSSDTLVVAGCDRTFIVTNPVWLDPTNVTRRPLISSTGLARLSWRFLFAGLRLVFSRGPYRPFGQTHWHRNSSSISPFSILSLLPLSITRRDTYLQVFSC
jgi:hypothetical protein